MVSKQKEASKETKTQTYLAGGGEGSAGNECPGSAWGGKTNEARYLYLDGGVLLGVTFFVVERESTNMSRCHRDVTWLETPPPLRRRPDLESYRCLMRGLSIYSRDLLCWVWRKNSSRLIDPQAQPALGRRIWQLKFKFHRAVRATR